MRSLGPRRIVFLALTLSAVLVPRSLRAQDAAALLPAGAHAVVAARDLPGFWQRFAGTQLYASISATAEMRAHLEAGLATWLELAGGSAAIGFYGESEGHPDAVAVTEVVDAARAREALAALEPHMAEHGATFTDERQGETTIRVARDSAGREALAWALVGDRLVAGSTRSRVDAAIHLAGGGGGAAMSADPGWSDAARRMAPASVVAWIDIENLPRSPETEAARASADRFARSIAVGFRWVEAGLQGDAHLTLDENTPPGIAALMSVPAGPVRSLGVTPTGALALYSGSLPDAESLLTGVRLAAMEGAGADSLAVAGAIAGGMARFEAETGIDLEEELLPALGREIALTVTGVDRGFMFPVPRIGLLLEVRDQAKALTVLEKIERWSAQSLLEKRSIPVSWQGEEYEGVSIRYAPTPLGESIEPAYAVAEGFALLASSRDVLRTLLDARADRVPSLGESPDFRAMDAFFPEQASVLTYLDVAGIVAQVRELATTYGGMIKIQGPGNVTPILDAIENVPRLGMWSKADPSGGVWWRVLLEVR